MTVRYQLRYPGKKSDEPGVDPKWTDVSREEYVAVERAAGYEGGDEPVNAGFGVPGEVYGRVVRDDTSNLFDDWN